MTPEELAARHPRLYHVTLAAAVEGIRRHGLLPTSELLSLFETPAVTRDAIEAQRRPCRVRLDHPVHGTAFITDNIPITAALPACLDDGLSPARWLRLLNERVFFFVDRDAVDGLANARANRAVERAVLVIDTLRLARAHAPRMELCAINSGNTRRGPARRGLSTFTPLGARSYADWRKLRGRTDRIKEVTIVGGIPDIVDHIVEVHSAGRRAPRVRTGEPLTSSASSR